MATRTIHPSIKPGDKFGRLVVLGEAEPRIYGSKRRRYWQCLCECGAKPVVGDGHLKAGHSTSCGCNRPLVSALVNTKHGHGRRSGSTSEHLSYKAMKQRCLNPNKDTYQHYGGRGIRICDRWLGPQGFATFLADMGPKPTPKHTLERKDVDGPYEPGNCVWATRHEQVRNRRDTPRVTRNGVTLSVNEWAERVGLTASCLRRRLARGWPIERALREMPKCMSAVRAQAHSTDTAMLGSS